MLSDILTKETIKEDLGRLNAPFGARCFLTSPPAPGCARGLRPRLNAPFGARCFLTEHNVGLAVFADGQVLMHLLALGAF